jgi:hypothetical protein
MIIRPRVSGKTKAFTIRNIGRVVSTILGLYYEVRISRILGRQGGRAQKKVQVK